MSAFWVSLPSSPVKFAGVIRFRTTNPDPKGWTRSAFWVASPASPGKFSVVPHFWGSNFGPKKMVEVRFLGRTTCTPKRHRRVPRSSRFYRVARKTTPLRSYGPFNFLAIYCLTRNLLKTISHWHRSHYDQGPYASER